MRNRCGICFLQWIPWIFIVVITAAILVFTVLSKQQVSERLSKFTVIRQSAPLIYPEELSFYSLFLLHNRFFVSIV